MKQYLDLLSLVLEQGTEQENRTGVNTISYPGAMMRFDLREGFPIVTAREINFRSATAEILGHLRGYSNAGEFRELGTKTWDANANKNRDWRSNPFRQGEDDLGTIYGEQWRAWECYCPVFTGNDEFKERERKLRKSGFYLLNDYLAPDVSLFYTRLDQVEDCLERLVKHEPDRRILFHAWNPAQLHQMALPPCHLLYQFLPNIRAQELSMCLYVRSNDLALGAPFNIVGGAIILELFSRLTGYTPRWFNYFIGDAHIYMNHMAGIQQLCLSDTYELPSLVIDGIPEYRKTLRFEPYWIDDAEPDDFRLENYQHGPEIKMEMVV